MRWRGPPRIMEKDLNYPLLGVWNGLETSSDSSHGGICETLGLFKLCDLSNVMGKVWFAGQLLAGCGWWCISWYLPYLPFPQLIFRYIDHLLEKCVGLESYFRNLLDTVFSFAFSLDCGTFFTALSAPSGQKPITFCLCCRAAYLSFPFFPIPAPPFCPFSPDSRIFSLSKSDKLQKQKHELKRKRNGERLCLVQFNALCK